MGKLWLIIQREYSIRVKRKMFIVTTLLTPLGFGLMMLVGGYLASQGAKTDNRVLVKDETGILADKIESSSTLKFEFDNGPIEELKNQYEERGSNILIHLEDGELDQMNPKYYSKEKLGIITIERIESKISRAVKEHKIDVSGIDRNLYDSFATNISIENGAVDDETSDSDTSSKLSTIIATAIGGVMGFLMYLVIFIYGGMVMRSVMEEKINRIVEVVISSVKPLQLMLGKILGVGAVGLTQLAIWMVLIPLMIFGVQMVLGGGGTPDQMAEISDVMKEMPKDSLNDFNLQQIIVEFMGMNWGMIIPVFMLFFFGGYFIYSALFAAIGSAVGDDMGESQQLMIPIVIPVVLAFIMAQSVIQNPNGSMAIFGSMFPLFSPILMPVRLAFDPPMWQILLSLAILILSCIFFAWIAGRIYRIGILMYGKKVSFREIGKWLFYKS